MNGRGDTEVIKVGFQKIAQKISVNDLIKDVVKILISEIFGIIV